METITEKPDDMRRLRNFIGVLGMLLPFLTLAFNLGFGRGYNPPGVFTSISATHYSSAYIFFEGIVCISSGFLLFYRGYDIGISRDRVASIIAGIGGFTLVLSPCKLEGAETRNFVMAAQDATNVFHLIGAGVFFACLVYIVGFRFVRTGEGGTVQPGSRKWRRNILYRVSAVAMAVALAIGFGGSRLFGFPYLVFIGESVALVVHGIAWCTKGGMWLRDV